MDIKKPQNMLSMPPVNTQPNTIIVPPEIPPQKYVFKPVTAVVPEWGVPLTLTFEEPCDYYHIGGVYGGRSLAVTLGPVFDRSRCFWLWRMSELLIPAVSQQVTLYSDGSGTFTVTVTALAGYMMRYNAGRD